MNIYLEVLGVFLAIVLGIFFLGAAGVLIFGEQDHDYNTGDLTCDEIRECILLDEVCLETDVTNYYLGMTWHVEASSRSKQSEYYKAHCLNKHLEEDKQ